MMRVGIICEGSTDFAVLEHLLCAPQIGAAEQCVLLQPALDKLRRGEASAEVPGPGWQGVRRFLQNSGPALAIGTFDLVVIQVDASIRKLNEIKKRNLRAPKTGEGDLEPLRDHVQSWAKGGLPDGAIVALPREELEAWLLAAHSNLKSVETVDAPAEELAKRGLIGVREDGAPHKTAGRYRELAGAVVKLASEPRKRARVAELARFVERVRSLL